MLDPVFVLLSVVGSLGLVWIAVAVAVAAARRLPSALMLVTAGVLSADMLALGLKLLGGRDRPFIADPEQDPLVGTSLDLSFPSGHAATSFAGATLLAWYAPRLTVPLYALAALVAWSRVYVGVHYPLDIVGGAILGAAVAIILLFLVRRRARAVRQEA